MLIDNKLINAIVDGDWAYVSEATMQEGLTKGMYIKDYNLLGTMLDVKRLDQTVWPISLALKECLQSPDTKHVKVFLALLDFYQKQEHPAYFETLIRFYQHLKQLKEQLIPAKELLFAGSPITEAVSSPYDHWIVGLEHRLCEDRLTPKAIENFEAYCREGGFQKSNIVAFLKQNMVKLHREHSQTFYQDMVKLLSVDEQGRRTWVSMLMLDELFNEEDALRPISESNFNKLCREGNPPHKLSLPPALLYHYFLSIFDSKASISDVELRLNALVALKFDLTSYVEGLQQHLIGLDVDDKVRGLVETKFGVDLALPAIVGTDEEIANQLITLTMNHELKKLSSILKHSKGKLNADIFEKVLSHIKMNPLDENIRAALNLLRMAEVFVAWEGIYQPLFVLQQLADRHNPYFYDNPDPKLWPPLLHNAQYNEAILPLLESFQGSPHYLSVLLMLNAMKRLPAPQFYDELCKAMLATDRLPENQDFLTSAVSNLLKAIDGDVGLKQQAMPVIDPKLEPEPANSRWRVLVQQFRGVSYERSRQDFVNRQVFEAAFNSVMRTSITHDVHAMINKEDVFYIYYLIAKLKLPFPAIKSLLTEEQRKSVWAFANVLIDRVTDNTYGSYFDNADKSVGFVSRSAFFCISLPSRADGMLTQFESSPCGSSYNSFWLVFTNSTSPLNLNSDLMLMGLIQFIFLLKNHANLQLVEVPSYQYTTYKQSFVRWLIDVPAFVAPYQYRLDLDRLAKLDLTSIPRCSPSFRAFIAWGRSYNVSYQYENNIQELKKVIKAFVLEGDLVIQSALHQKMLLDVPCPLTNILLFNPSEKKLTATQEFKEVRQALKGIEVTPKTVRELNRRLMQAPTPRDAALYLAFSNLVDHAALIVHIKKYFMQKVSNEALVELNRAMKLLSEDESKYLRERLSKVSLVVAKREGGLTEDDAWVRQLREALEQSDNGLPFIEILRTSGSGKRDQNTTTYNDWKRELVAALKPPPAPKVKKSSGKVFALSHMILLPSKKLNPLAQDPKAGFLPDAKVFGSL